MGRIDGEGRVTNGPLAPIDTSLGKPSELCWLQVTSDNSLVLATNFGYGTVSTYRLAEGRLSLLQDPANEAIPATVLPRRERARQQRTQRQLVDSRRPVLLPDLWKCPVLVSYRLDKTSGRLTEIGRNPIPYNSPQGLAGF